MAEYVTKSDLNASLDTLQTSMTNLSQQFAILKTQIQGQSPQQELITFKSNFDEQINSINLQIQQLKASQPSSQDVSRELAAVNALFNDKITSVLNQLAILQKNITQFASDYKGTTGFVAYQSIIDDKINTINQQLQVLRQSSTSTNVQNVIQSVSTDYNSKIDAINQQIQILKSNIQNGQTTNIDQYKALIDEEIQSVTQQLLTLRSNITNLQDVAEVKVDYNTINTFIEQKLAQIQTIHADVDYAAIGLMIDRRIDEIPVPSGVAPGESNVSFGSFLIDVDTTNDAWSGTEYVDDLLSTSVILVDVYGQDITTEIVGKKTLFEIDITTVRNGSFDWAIYSYARVTGGQIKVSYSWNGTSD